MKNKILTFHNLLALLGIVAILLFLCPAFLIYKTDMTSESQNIYYNLFTVVFGGSFGPYFPAGQGFKVCAPLVFASVCIIIGIVCNIGSNKIKWLNYIGFAFYATAGILFLCGEMIVKDVNIGADLGMGGKIWWQGGIVAVGSLLCSIAFVTLITALMSSSKPKVQETY